MSADVVTVVGAGIEQMLVDLHERVRRIADIVSVAALEGRLVAGQDLPGLRAAVEAGTARVPWMSGAGFVAAVDALEGRRRSWEWWSRAAGPIGSVERLHPPRSSPSHADYPYESAPWYREAEAGRPGVFGPFVDFAGVNALVVLFATPVAASGRFLGVVGADLAVDRFELSAVRWLRQLPETAVLASAHDRVVASSNPLHAPGDRFDAAGWRARAIDPRRAGWTLYTPDS